MSLIPFENYVCRPHPEQDDHFIVSAIKESASYCQPGFVSLMYDNPGKLPVRYKYYQIIDEIILHLPQGNKNGMPHRLKARTDKTNYIKQVQAIKNEIQLGNIYEMNYCLEFYEENTKIDVINTFQQLIARTKAPYCYLIKLNDNFLICCSPELFLKKDGSILKTKPIKGTIKRGKDLAEDARLKNQLQQSLKERTENVMAVDVARNDLSKIAERGSVNVNALYHIETFETVHQMVSTVSCKLASDITFDQIIQATFPMASMTGAPKLSAMDCIERFENFHRGMYSGSFGLINANGDFELPVVIRSIYYNQEKNYLSLAAGGAITYLSNPEQEYDEIILKLSAQMTVLNASIDL